MFEYVQSSEVARSRVAAERYAVVSAAVAAKAESAPLASDSHAAWDLHPLPRLQPG